LQFTFRSSLNATIRTSLPMPGADSRKSGNAPRPRRTIIPSRPGLRITCVPTQRAATVELRSSLYADATAIVEREYAADLSLDSIARRVASSRRQLQRAYSEIGDTTFREHLTRVRMERAAELLERRGMTVREVARRVGYRQPAQFAKAFRRHLGVAPSDFRAAGGGGRGVVGDGHRLAA
jgi:AraC family transcriptional regulator, regulatory protein of adaptative response / methylphosphotriester-DNA alkyltransferase methyltransferase